MVLWLRTLVAFVCLVCGLSWCISCEAQDAGATEQLWIDRLIESMKQLAADPDSKSAKPNIQYAFSLAMLSLGQHGRVEAAHKLLRTLDDGGFADLHEEGLLFLADGLSARDDVKAAVETARSIQSPALREQALALVAVRQSQRGDFQDAESQLALIESARARDLAAKQICSEYIKLAKWEEARRMADKIEDAERKRKAMAELGEAEARPGLTEPGYVEYQLEQAKSGPLGGASTERIAFLEQYYRAEVALETQKPDQFLSLAQAAQDLAKEVTGTERDATQLLLGRLFFKAGRKDDAKAECSALLQKYAEEKDDDLASLDFNKLLFSHGNPSDAMIVAQCFPESELKPLVKRLIANKSSRLVGASILGAAIRQSNPAWAEEIARKAEPSLKLEIAACYLVR